MLRNRFALLAPPAQLCVLLSLAALFAPQPCRAESIPAPRHGSLLFRSPRADAFEEIPLKRTEVSIDVTGLVASTTVTQRFANEATDPLEAVYVFPLPHDAAVYDMEIRVADRIIKSVVKEREEANRTYEAAKAEGRRAALVDEERPNIFTTKVANIMPKDEVEVRLRYVEPLIWDGGALRLTFPTVVGPRFFPGESVVGHAGTGWAMDTDAVADASRITPLVLVRSEQSPSARPDLVIEVTLNIGLPLASVTSPTHAITVEPGPSGASTVRLAAGAAIPNKDFVLSLRRSDDAAPSTALFLSKKTGEEDASLMLVAFPPSVDQMGQRSPLEMLYLIDISGSMHGTSIHQAKEALLQALDRLRPEDRFNIVAFDNTFFGLHAEPVAATGASIEDGRRFVTSLEARGGTMMLPALEHVMAMPKSPDAIRDIVVLTDGDLGNEEQIFASLRRNLGDARLFTVAIGSAPNHFLATKMAQFGRGTFTQIASVNEIAAQMGKLLDQIESPVLSDLQLSVNGLELTDVVPSRIPDLFHGQPLVVFGRVKGNANHASVTLTGREGHRSFRKELPMSVAAATFHPGLASLWARRRVDQHLDAFRSATTEEKPAIRRTIVDLALRYNLVTRFTSRVAVEDIIVNRDAPPRTTTVPTELPEGWSARHVLGENPHTGNADDFLARLGLVCLVLAGTLLVLTRMHPHPGEAAA